MTVPAERLDAPPGSALIGDFVRYLRSERGRSEHTIRAYASDVAHLARHLGARDASAADRAEPLTGPALAEPATGVRR